MQTISLDEAKTQLETLLNAAANGEEVFITTKELKFQLVPRPIKKNREAGSAKGLIEMMPDFDEPLEDFKEYME